MEFSVLHGNYRDTYECQKKLVGDLLKELRFELKCGDKKFHKLFFKLYKFKLQCPNSKSENRRHLHGKCAHNSKFPC